MVRCPAVWYWLLALSLTLAVSCTSAHAADAPPALNPSLQLVPVLSSPPPRAETPPELSLQVGVGRTISTGLVIAGGAAVFVGAFFPFQDGYAAYGLIALYGLGAAVTTVGAGVALGTATALKRDGGRVSLVPGWIAIGAMATGATLLLATNGDPTARTVAFATVPVILGGAGVQLYLNERSRSRLLLGVTPLPSGAQATLSLRF